jgi:hypothetical protein
MSEIETYESSHERKVTWSLMAAVVAFVVVMSCVVIWVTTSLIQSERGAAVPLIGPSGSATPAPPTIAPTTAAAPSETPTVTAEARSEPSNEPALVDATWTPIPGPRRYVRWNYWFVKPNKITVGECVQITWETEFAAKLQLYRNGELILDDAPTAKTLEDCPTELGYVVYRMVGENSFGESSWIQLQVRVVAAP